MRAYSRWRRFILLLPLIIYLFHTLSVIQVQKNPTSELRHRNKFDHLVLGSAAGQGLPNRLQCQGTRALNKTHSVNSGNGEKISFVSVFTTYNSSIDGTSTGQSRDSITVGHVSYNKVERSLAILNIFINFIQVFLEKRLEELSHSKEQINHYIFTDSDIAVVHDLGEMFDYYPDFHVALTFRNNKEQPLNSGFIAVRGTPDGIRRAKVFLEEVLEVYSSKYMKASRMLGDQLALAWVVKSHPSFDSKSFTKPHAFQLKLGGVSVLFLPCAVYNWTPPEGAGQFHGMPLDVKVVHFKGSRKRLMLESWNFLSSNSSDISDMLCLILKSGRSKYDF